MTKQPIRSRKARALSEPALADIRGGTETTPRTQQVYIVYRFQDILVTGTD